MIAVAGYINYSDNHLGIDKTLKKDADTAETSASDTDAITEEIESLDYDITDESALLKENSKAAESEAVESEGGKEKETASADGEENLQTETPGEAVLTGASGFVAEAKVSREQVRSANKETLLGIINNENLGDGTEAGGSEFHGEHDQSGRAGGSCRASFRRSGISGRGGKSYRGQCRCRCAKRIYGGRKTGADRGYCKAENQCSSRKNCDYTFGRGKRGK